MAVLQAHRLHCKQTSSFSDEEPTSSKRHFHSAKEPLNQFKLGAVSSVLTLFVFVNLFSLGSAPGLNSGCPCFVVVITSCDFIYPGKVLSFILSSLCSHELRTSGAQDVVHLAPFTLASDSVYICLPV